MTVDHQKIPWTRRAMEIGVFAALVGLLWTMDTLTKMRILAFSDPDYDRFRLIAAQATSGATVLLLVPAVAWWLTLFPLARDKALQSAVGHVAGTVIFAAAHYWIMILMRHVVYTAAGESFVYSTYWFQNMVFEYQKDIKIYVGIVAIVTGYRYYRRHQASAVQTRPDRLIVQTGSGEAVVRQDEIEYLEAARNYVVVGTGEREYLVRETLANLEKTLAPEHIVRTHRSYLVNLDRIREIRARDSGGHEIRMQSGKQVPLSRGFRDKFKSHITGNAGN